MSDRVAVIGGGAAGLGAADALAESGRRVSVIEAGPALGGLARTVTIGGEPIEAYYHHIFPQDRETRQLIGRLGLRDRLEWRHGPMAILHDGRVHPFDGPLDILRFPPLRIDQRLRLAAASALHVPRLRFAGVHRAAVGTDGPRWFGRRAYDILWRPLLEAKFGPYAPDVATAWLASRIAQRAAARRVTGDRLGYLSGGLGTLFAALAADLESRGVEIRTSTRVQSIVREGAVWRITVERDGAVETVEAGAIVAALSGGILARLVDLPAAYASALGAIPYRGVVCVLLELDRPVSRHYWVNVTDRLGLGCVGLIEHTNFIPAERYGGRSVMYLAHYVGRDEPAWSASVDELVAAVEPALRTLNPAFDRSWIVNSIVSRDPFAQPVPLVGGPMPSLPIETGLPGLFHVSLAHVYPDDRGVSLAIRVGRRAAAAVQRYLTA